MKWKGLNFAPLSLCMSIAIAPAHAAKNIPKGFSLSKLSIGLGYDSNVYLTPKKSYLDLAQPGSPLIVPKVQSGFYTP